MSSNTFRWHFEPQEGVEFGVVRLSQLLGVGMYEFTLCRAY
jgi:hypothetical protein